MSVYGSTSFLTKPLNSGLRVPASVMGKERKMKVFYGAIEVVVSPFQKYHLEMLFVKTKQLFVGNCVLLLALYCCDRPESKNTSEVRHDDAVKKTTC